MQEIRFKQSGVPVGKLFMNFMACSGLGTPSTAAFV